VLEGERQRVGSARDDDQMNMIRHETIAQQREVMEVRITSKQIEIHCPVGIAGENELPGISTLGNVMGYVDNDDASQASHIRQSSRKRPVCPQVLYIRIRSVVPDSRRAGFLLLALCTSLICLLAGCRDDRLERFYPSLNDAKKDGAIQDGYIPYFVPDSFRNIHELYDQSPATEWCAFEFLPADSDSLQKNLRRVDALPPEVNRIVNPGKSWWPSMLVGNLDVGKIHNAGFELSVAVVPETQVSNTIFLFAIERTKGRGFFYSVHQHIPECFPNCGK